MNEKELTCLVSEEISNRFVEAIKNDNVEGLRTLLKVGISINSQIDYKVWNRRSLLCVGGRDIKASRIMLLDSSVITLCLNLFNRAHYSKDSEFIGICVSQKNLWDTCA